jgi:hypothetical protein
VNRGRQSEQVEVLVIGNGRVESFGPVNISTTRQETQSATHRGRSALDRIGNGLHILAIAGKRNYREVVTLVPQLPVPHWLLVIHRASVIG